MPKSATAAKAAPKSDIEIAQAATMRPIAEVAARLDIAEERLEPYGRYKAKVLPAGAAARPGQAKLVLVTAITPTPAGEGKTTVTVGLGDALNRIGKRAAICLREPSLGPCFGMKGGAAGGGYAQVVPMEDINLHFTGDIHAIGVANNLLAALVDNHMYWGNAEAIDARRVAWRRALDLNDRALRHIACGLGGPANGFPREDGFDITVASEVMAILCLASDRDDLQRRLGNIVVGFTRERTPVRASALDAQGALSALLRDALNPNLVQTLEHNPAFVHGGPFANIAHGCNSVMATRMAMGAADYVVTEAGFGADLGAEKFFDIKCRKAGLKPSAAVVVATVRALKMHGGVARGDLGDENVEAVRAGLENLGRHIGNIRKFGVPPVVAINQFIADTDAEMAVVREYCDGLGVDAYVCSHWANGGAGTEELATKIAEVADSGVADFKPLYGDELSLWDKIRTVAKEIYGADDATADGSVMNQIEQYEKEGYGRFPVCMAKTQYSFSSNPDLKGAPSGFTVPVREVRLSAGAEFIVAICGAIMTMPGLPRVPAANSIYINDKGDVEGLF